MNVLPVSPPNSVLRLKSVKHIHTNLLEQPSMLDFSVEEETLDSIIQLNKNLLEELLSE